jgi:hypothetical protein
VDFIVSYQTIVFEINARVMRNIYRFFSAPVFEADTCAKMAVGFRG